MKNVIYFLFITWGIFACNPTKSVSSVEKPVVPSTPVQKSFDVEFDRVLEDFGIIQKGDKKETSFTMTNTGQVDVVIELITSCDCTTLEYPRMKPIKPGEKAVIGVVFDSTEKEKGEMVDIDILFLNKNPKNGYPIVKTCQYKFELAQ